MGNDWAARATNQAGDGPLQSVRRNPVRRVCSVLVRSRSEHFGHCRFWPGANWLRWTNAPSTECGPGRSLFTSTSPTKTESLGLGLHSRAYSGLLAAKTCARFAVLNVGNQQVRQSGRKEGTREGRGHRRGRSCCVLAWLMSTRRRRMARLLWRRGFTPNDISALVFLPGKWGGRLV